MNEQMTLPASTRSAGAAARVAEVVGDSLAGRRIVENFALLVEAAGSVPKLRQLVLTLAVSGRLSQQKASDGTAAALLASLAGKSSTPRKAKLECAPVEQDAGPFVLPHSWCWARFLDVASIDSHLVDPAGFVDLPHVAPDNIEKGTGRLMEYRTIREDGVTSSKHRFFSGQIVYSKIRPNLSKVVVVDFDGLCSADMYPLTAKIDRGYLHCFMLSQVFLDQVVREDNRLAMPKVNQEQLAATLVAVPPLAEQKRIVAKVDQLMALCDDLEARQNKKREVGARLTKSALEALTTAEGPEEFDAAWKRVVENFDVLIDRAEKVAELRKSILGIAFQGRLTSQFSHEEPARTILEALGISPSDRASLRMPKEWEVASLGAIATVKSGATLDPQLERTEGDWPYLKIADMNLPGNEVEITTSSRFIKANAQLKRHLIGANSVIFPKRGGAIATNKKRIVRSPVLVDLNTMAFTCPSEMCFEYLFYWFLTVDLGALDNGTTVPQINHKDIAPLAVPIAPIDEQKRIVARVEKLMSVCDDLAAKLRAAEDLASKLVEAAVSELVA